MDKKEMSLGLKKTLISKELSEANIKASGDNRYSDYTYLELSDFMPTLLKLMEKYEVYTIFDFGNDDRAILQLCNCSGSGVITTGIKLVDIKLKACNDMQNIGAVHTYARRYLYMAMFDIVEADILNKQVEQPTQPIKKSPKLCINQNQINLIYAKLKENGIVGEDAEKSIKWVIKKMINEGELSDESKKDIPQEKFGLFLSGIESLIKIKKQKEGA